MKSLLAATFAVALSACATHDPAASRSAGGESDPFAGKWVGRWTSEHHQNSGGALHCTLTALPPNPQAKPGISRYSAHFKANWLTFSKSYDVPLEGRRRGDELHFHGTHELAAIFGGVYTFDGTATPERFVSNYKSSYDHGKFIMTRPPAR